MQAFKVTYQNGQFIDKATKRRIIPVQGHEYIINGDAKAFTQEDEKLKLGVALTKEEKAAWAVTKYGNGKFNLLLHAGQKLFFRVGNSKTVSGDPSQQYIFLCSLLEDQYLFLANGKDGKSYTNWRLSPCMCAVEECLLGGMALTQKIAATSLNKLFSQIVMFYFSMQRSGATNVFTNFFLYKENMNITFEGAMYIKYDNVEQERKKVVAEINK